MVCLGSQSDGTVHHGSEDMAAGVRFLVILDPQAGSSSKDWCSGMPDNGWRLLYSGQVETYTQTGEREGGGSTQSCIFYVIPNSVKFSVED